MLLVKKKIQKKILKDGSHDKLWSYSDFAEFKRANVANAFSDLCKDNVIARAGHGYYYLPKMTILGITPPNTYALAIKTAYDKKATFACISGICGYNKIGLTTQVPNILIIACDVKIRSTIARTKYVLRNRPHSGSEIERIILDALIDIEKIPDADPYDSLNKIKNIIKSGKVNINDLGKSALKEQPRLRHIVGALGMELGMAKKLINELKSKINPNTVIYSATAANLKHAETWRIKLRMK